MERFRLLLPIVSLRGLDPYVRSLGLVSFLADLSSEIAYPLFPIDDSSDMFILLKAKDVGLGTSAVFLLYALCNVVYSAGSLPLGELSDRVGRYLLAIAARCHSLVK